MHCTCISENETALSLERQVSVEKIACTDLTAQFVNLPAYSRYLSSDGVLF